MGFSHEKLDVYLISIQYIKLSFNLCKHLEGKKLLDRIVAMLTKLGGRGYAVQEDSALYEVNKDDIDPDTDSNTDKK